MGHFPASIFILLLLVVGSRGIGQAEVRYVDLNSVNPAPPYSTWATAATNIQDAVDAAAAGDQILLTNGVYRSGGRVAPTNSPLPNSLLVIKAVVIQSVNGPGTTAIDGAGVMRCVFLTEGAVLSGLTLTNGNGRKLGDGGGGARCESVNVLLTNCVLAGNVAADGGGAYGGTLSHCTLRDNRADYSYGGGAYSSSLDHCTLLGNSAYITGGGAYLSTLKACTLTNNGAGSGGGASGSTLEDCTLTGNRGGIAGGGAVNSTLNRCLLTGNSSDGTAGGGGAQGATLNDCTLIANRSDSASGGGGASGSTLNNCILTNNSGTHGGGASGATLNNCLLVNNSAEDGGGAAYGMLNNCTLAGNSARDTGGGASGGTLNNCIVYYNTAPDGDYNASCRFNYCCTTPLPFGPGNFANAPLFVDLAGGNLRLQSNSPCINAGNNDYVATSVDLDGNPRIVGGTVDVGAYESPVVPNPFPPAAGTYAGLFYETDKVTQASSGSVGFQLTQDGALSGKLRLAGSSYALSGQFLSDGSCSNAIVRKQAPPLVLQLQLNFGDADSIGGTLSDGNWVAIVLANRAVYSASNAAPQAGQYTLAVAGGDDPQAAPPGYGALTIKVSLNGSVRVKGSLSDGTRLTAGTFVSGRGEWPLYATPYSGDGLVIGWLAFTNDTASLSDLEGMVAWIKPPQAGAKYYPNGFSLPLDERVNNAFGSAYTNQTPVLDWTDGAVVLEYGNLSEPLLTPVSFSGDRGVGTNRLNLKISAGSGRFAGSVIGPDSKKPIGFDGVLLQRRGAGYGFFLGTNQSGRVRLSQ